MRKNLFSYPLSAIRHPRHKTVGQALILIFFLMAGCGPKYTYPSDKVTESIEKICLDENGMIVQARVVGKTAGALFYTQSVLDATGQAPKEVQEEMGKAIQAVTRVALATDRPIDFCVVVIRDRQNPLELVITRALDDTKRGYADIIGVEESINRTLFGQAKITPDPEGQTPFILKEVLLERFLTDQIVQRIRFGLAKDLKETKKSKKKTGLKEKPIVLVDGVFEEEEGRRIFKFSVLPLKQDNPQETTLSVFKIVNQVFAGYHFTDFDSIEVRDYLNRQKLVVDKPTLDLYQKKKIADKELLERFLVESKAAQEAFKLFGFKMPPEATDADELLLPTDEEV